MIVQDFLFRKWIIVKKKLSGSMSIRSISAFKDPNVAKHLSLLHEKYVIVLASKAPSNKSSFSRFGHCLA
jgi:hypothetical protein